ncbi:MAG: AAA family ATPase, partial [Clostridia bacterium]|nr:AAA family ATPase [Clostridia bacterium]
MRINKLSVASFGKLRNSRYELGSGLNVIYGPNESGKSTMLSFMRFMLFGCHGRKGSSNLTFEEKYQPWDNTALSGSMDFEAYGQCYHTARSVGVRKEYGTLNSNGSSAFDGIEPGEAIYNMNESAFLRSFYLSANSCKISADKNDDILKGLSNFADTGDE